MRKRKTTQLTGSIILLCCFCVFQGIAAGKVGLSSHVRPRRQATGSILSQETLANLFRSGRTDTEETTEENATASSIIPTNTTPDPPVQTETTTHVVVSTNPTSDPTVSGTCSEECVPYYLCRNGKVITDGQGILDVRFGSPKVPRFQTSPETEVNELEGSCPGFLQVCCRHVEEFVIPEYTPRCGRHNVNGLFSRMSALKEKDTQFGELPWMVMLIEMTGEKKNEELYICGGSLIEEDVILTAAHCVQGRNTNSLKVRLGEWDTNREDELLSRQDIAVHSYVYHEKFTAGNLWYDVALVFLQHSANLTHHVDTICLPEPNFNFTGSNCLTAGWGSYDLNMGSSDRIILKKDILLVVPSSECEDMLERTRLSRFFRLHPSFICAGNEFRSDSCMGDGGGPLACATANSSDRYVQVGIVSWGIGCGFDSTPGVYTDVIKFTGWIQDKIIVFHGGKIPAGKEEMSEKYVVQLSAGPVRVQPLDVQ